MTFRSAILAALRLIIPTVLAVAITSAVSSARAAPCLESSVAAVANVSAAGVAPQV
jgi:hypothetical protein